MELKEEGGFRTFCLSSFSSPGTLVGVSGGGFFFFENVVKKSDQSYKTTKPQSSKNMVEVPQFLLKKCASTPVCLLPNNTGEDPLGGIAVALNRNAKIATGVVSLGGE